MDKYQSEFMNALEVMEVLKKCPLDIFLKVYHKIKGTPGKIVMKKKTHKVTLEQVVNMMNDGFKKMDAKMDAGFKQVNTRIDGIEARLDYNGLKKLPTNYK
ncbi:MAG: hypothetical protein MJ207_00205 [Bacilli bacterium]|nr:hypothetical protein [Bacilli bacterium]